MLFEGSERYWDLLVGSTAVGFNKMGKLGCLTIQKGQQTLRNSLNESRFEMEFEAFGAPASFPLTLAYEETVCANEAPSPLFKSSRNWSKLILAPLPLRRPLIYSAVSPSENIDLATLASTKSPSDFASADFSDFVSPPPPLIDSVAAFKFSIDFSRKTSRLD